MAPGVTACFVHALFELGCGTHAAHSVIMIPRPLGDPGGHFAPLYFDLIRPIGILLGGYRFTQRCQSPFGLFRAIKIADARVGPCRSPST